MKLVDNRGVADPCLNLALEEYLVRDAPLDDYLLLYVNEPCVVLGKHQSPLEETDLIWTTEAGIPIVRRLSGGGTVVHDLGNLNITRITRLEPALYNNYQPFLQPVIDWLGEQGVATELNNRNSLIESSGRRKISGNAQFSSRGRLLSHGTLLIDSDLERLRRALRPSLSPVSSRAVQSNRSSVVNLRELLNRDFTTAEMLEIVRGCYRVDDDSLILADDVWSDIQALADSKYRSWEWTFGRTPRCEIETPDHRSRLLLQDGFVSAVEGIDSTGEHVHWERLLGRRLDVTLLRDLKRGPSIETSDE